MPDSFKIFPWEISSLDRSLEKILVAHEALATEVGGAKASTPTAVNQRENRVKVAVINTRVILLFLIESV